MKGIRSKQAIIAGLLSCNCVFAPHYAYATRQSLTPFQPNVDFGFGLLTGVGISGLIATISYFLVQYHHRHDSATFDEFSNNVEISNLKASKDGCSLSTDVPVSALHASDDYADVATNYVRHQSFKERMATRAQGVVKILKDRLSSDRFDDLPVIERADGSVGDVGTSWWEARVGKSAAHVGDEDSYQEMAPVDFSHNPTWLEEETQNRKSNPVKDTISSYKSRADYIRNSIAEVNEGTYPAKRSVEELDHEDLWEVALHNMNEKIIHADDPEPLKVSVDLDSLDEVDNMSNITAFIPFKAPANHPEVVDRDSYVDYLLADEFSRNESGIARKSSHRYLKVLEGGSQTLPLRFASNSHSATRLSHVPKHMASSPAKSCVFPPKHFAETAVKEA